MARLKEAYNKVIIAELMKKIGYKNIHQVPKLEKIVINMGVSDAKENPKAIEISSSELAVITGQKPLVRRAKKSISAFKLREGTPNGLKVTLRNNIMYEFFDRFVNIAIPRIRDFRGLDVSKFDGRGNYNIGLNEQYIFPEVSLDKSDKARGMNITIVTTAKTDSEAKELLAALGMPFKKTVSGKS